MSAGEPSGDRIAARVAEELGREGARLYGLGGSLAQGAGIELISRTDGMAAVGLSGVVRALSSWLDLWARTRREIDSRPPDAALLVDSPELNLPLARALKTAGARVVQYVGPQVWAWRPSRLGLLRDRTDFVALVLPFEKPLYDRAGVRADFVGHPLVDEKAAVPGARVRRLLHVAPGRGLVTLLPGSRRSEVEALAPAMVDAGLRLLRAGITPVLAPFPGTLPPRLEEAARSAGCAFAPRGLAVRDLLGASDAAIAASGTVTLEAALEGVPMVVAYRLGSVSWRLARRLVRVDHIALPNLIAGREIVPEFLQGRVTGANLAAAAMDLLGGPSGDRQREALFDVARSLGRPGVAGRVADLVMELV